MRSGTIAFLAGILCLQLFPALPASGWIFLLGVSIPAALWLGFPWRLAGWLISGFLWALWSAHSILSVTLPPELEGQDLILVGHVAGLPESGQRRTRFLLDVDHYLVAGERQAWPARVRLNWYGQQRPALQPGQTWRLEVRLKRPRGFRNPGSFDYERWLFAERIRATGYVRYDNRPLVSRPVPWRYRLDQWRQRLSQALQQPLAGQAGALFRALSVGDRRDVDSSTWEVLRVTGTAHLLAISGMHIGLLAALVFWLTRYLWRLGGERLLLWLPAPRAAALLATLAALVYAAMAGFAIPTQRALVMLAVVMLALWRLRPLAPGRTLAWAALLVLLLDPLAVLSAGFWLSFAAVALILYALGGARPRSRLHQWLRIQGWITLGLAPLLIAWFQQVSLVAPLANLLAIPLVSLLIVPLALLGTLATLTFPALGNVLLTGLGWLLEGMLEVLQSMAAWPFSHWQTGTGSAGALLLLGAGLLLLLAPRGLPGRYLAPVLCLPLLLGSGARPPPGQAWLTLLDVGQGLSAAVQTRSRLLIFDTGARYSTSFDTGAAVVVPYVRHSGYSGIDHLVISHGDNDHIGGLASVRQALPVGRLSTSVPEQIPGAGHRACEAGQRWQWDGVHFQFLAPAPGRLGGNDASCVLRIEAGEQVALLSGDIEQAGERALLRRQRAKLAADILVAPHHGSLTSSTPAFVTAVNPDYVLYPVGYRNRYRFPRPAVVARYTAVGARQYRVDEEGALRFVLGEADGVRKLFSYREANRRYWHSRVMSVD
ncbi:MAG: DNA internalization-related competence protein ComEC/Rec2 [Pseudomonadota bacterium]|nr:DNA internalization-related competence protein ComEC/Rec2 [Pseudomonadota bacterium]